MNVDRARVIMLVAMALLLAGCTPQYPKCKSDEDCKADERCVNGQCQQCAVDKDCGPGERCADGRCEPIPDYCQENSDCPDGKACKDDRCVACAKDADCGRGGRCVDGRCVGPIACETDQDCPENHECQDGVCVAPPGPGSAEARCQPKPVYFDFNTHILTNDATKALQRAATCSKSVPGRNLRLEGHCDPRGTEEYNLALSDRRARSVRRYLRRLGLDASRLRHLSKGELEARGTDEATWAEDRKVLFIWD